MKKNHDIRIRLSLDELDKVKQKASMVGMNISDFVRYLIFNINLKVSYNVG